MGVWSPEMEQRKSPELRVELIAQCSGSRIVVWDLAPVGRVHRPRRDADIGRRVHVVPPEQVGANAAGIAPARSLPDPLAGNEMVGLPPEHDLGEAAKIPAVAHYSML